MAGALQRAAEALRDQKVPFALIGGLAVGGRGVPRFTADLDFAVSVEAAQEESETLPHSFPRDIARAAHLPRTGREAVRRAGAFVAHCYHAFILNKRPSGPSS